MIENFEKLNFNQKVDVLVEMHVMGWKDIVIEQVAWARSNEMWAGIGVSGLYVPLYSTLLTSAWGIVNKFDYMHLFRSKDFKKGQWECKLVEDPYCYAYAWAETVQLAICYAGLKTVGFDVKAFLQEEEKNKENNK